LIKTQLQERSAVNPTCERILEKKENADACLFDTLFRTLGRLEPKWIVKHSKSKLLHYVADGMLRVLACGRIKSDMYVAPGVLRYDSAVCHACQRAAGKD